MNWWYAFDNRDLLPIDHEHSLLAAIHEASEARLNASRRLRYLNRTLAFALALVSAALIWMNVWPMVRPFCPTATQLSGLYSIGLSLVMSLVSVLVYAGEYGHKSEMFNECSNALGRLWREYEREIETKNVTKDYVSAYYDILDEYSDQHEMVDYMKYRIAHRVGRISWAEYFKFRVRIVLAHYYGIIGLAMVTISVGWLVWFVEFATPYAECVK